MGTIFGRTAEERLTRDSHPVYLLGGVKVSLAALTDADQFTDIPFDFAGKLTGLRIMTGDVVVSTGSKLSTLTVHINATAVGGLTAALTSAAFDTKGEVVFDVTPSGFPSNYTFTASDTWSIVGSATTGFSEGDVRIWLIAEREG